MMLWIWNIHTFMEKIDSIFRSSHTDKEWEINKIWMNMNKWIIIIIIQQQWQQQGKPTIEGFIEQWIIFGQCLIADPHDLSH